MSRLVRTAITSPRAMTRRASGRSAAHWSPGRSAGCPPPCAHGRRGGTCSPPRRLLARCSLGAEPTRCGGRGRRSWPGHGVGWACSPLPAGASDSDPGGRARGAAIAALDLVVVFAETGPAIAQLPQVPQWADHLVFGALVGLHL